VGPNLGFGVGLCLFSRVWTATFGEGYWATGNRKVTQSVRLGWALLGREGKREEDQGKVQQVALGLWVQQGTLGHVMNGEWIGWVRTYLCRSVLGALAYRGKVSALAPVWMMGDGGRCGWGKAMEDRVESTL
jgi:hypothetical protein